MRTAKNQAELNLINVAKEMDDSFSKYNQREERRWGHLLLRIGQLRGCSCGHRIEQIFVVLSRVDLGNKGRVGKGHEPTVRATTLDI